MGRRSLLGAYNGEILENSRSQGISFKRVTYVASDWQQAFEVFQWSKRAEAYDRWKMELIKQNEIDSLEQFKSSGIQGAILAFQSAQQLLAATTQRHLEENRIGQNGRRQLSISDHHKLTNALKNATEAMDKAHTLWAKSLGIQQLIEQQGEQNDYRSG